MERFGTARLSRFGWFWLGAGALWKSAEVLHTAAYLKSIVVDDFDGDAVSSFLLSAPPLLLTIIGCVWLIYFRQRRQGTGERNQLPTHVQAVSPRQKDRCAVPVVRDAVIEVVVRTRTVHETETIYREVPRS